MTRSLFQRRGTNRIIESLIQEQRLVSWEPGGRWEHIYDKVAQNQRAASAAGAAIYHQMDKRLQANIPQRRRDPPWPTFRIWYLGTPVEMPIACSRVRCVGITCLSCLRYGTYFTMPTDWSETQIEELYDMANPHVEKVAKEKGVSIFNAYDLIKNDPTLVPEGVIKQYIPRNQKTAIRNALSTLGPCNLDELYAETSKDRTLNLDMHNLVHVLHSMKKQSEVSFKQSNGGQAGQDLQKITLLAAGYRAAGTTPTERVTVKKETKMNGAFTPVTKGDMTKPSAHKAVAQGGPIEVIKPPRVEQNVKPDVVAEFPPFVAERIPEQVAQKYDLVDYPMIRELAARQSKVEAAAKLLDEAGQPDLALSALSKIEYTAFEKEVLRLWESLS